MSATKIIKAFAKKSLTKDKGSGITSLPSEFMAAEKAAQIEFLLSRAGIPLEQLDDYIRSEADLLKFLNIIEATNKPTVYSGQAAADQLNKLFPKKGEVVKFPQKRSFAEEIEAMKKSGDIVDEDKMVISDKITNREMFKDANKRFNTKEKPIDPDFYDGPFDSKAEELAEIRMSNEGFIADTIARITSMEPVTALKEANKIIKREGVYKNLNKDQSQAILKSTDDWINQRDPSDLYDYNKNRPFRDDPNFDPDDPDFDPEQGFYTGGMVDVEPSLSDIGHGSDALMARTRLVSPNSQATTSTGLNYLLAEDNDNIRVPFSAGGGGRRAVLKLLAALTGGVAAAKSGILSLGGKEAGKQVAKEVVQSAGSGQPPPYFFKLVEKIKTLGDETMATQDNTIAKKYKDYVMEEDFAGNISITKKNMDDPYPEEVFMSYKVDEVTLPGKKGSAKVDDYEEFTIKPDGDGKMKDIEPGVPDEVVQEGTMFEDNITEFGKAEGGRIGFSGGGGLFNVLSRLGITGSSRRFLEKAFGKENFENMIKNDPDMHRGLLEVVEMFRNRDKEGLKMYMQKFLPHMDDATVEEFIVGTTPDIEGLTGQLTRLGGGRDYAQKLQMMKKADEVKKLENFDIKNVTKNAEGGRIELKGGGDALKALLNYFAKEAGKKGSQQLKDINPKALDSGILNIMGPEHLKMLQKNQTDYLENLLNVIKSDKKFLDQNKKLAETMMKDAPEGFEDQAQNIVKMMIEGSMGKGGRLDRLKIYDKINIDDANVDVEQMIKNRRVKESDGRALNASGGLAKMLGE